METIWLTLEIAGIAAAMLLLIVLILWFPRYVLYAILFSIPLSVDFSISGVNLSSPAEPLLLIYSGVLLFKSVITQKLQILKKGIPQTPLILLWFTGLIWMGFSVLWSEFPLVSIKKTIILTIYSGFFFIYLSKEIKTTKEWSTLLNFYIAGTAIAVMLVLIQHSKYDFLLNVSAEIPKPYYAEHTVYGACLAFILPYTFLNLFRNRQSLLKVGLWSFLTLYFSAALFISASRASWLSVVLAIFAGIFLYYRFRFRNLMIGVTGVLLLAFVFQEQLFHIISKNDAQSNNNQSNVKEHFLSVANLSSDVSNRERINRWYSAIQMVKERPVSGYGPGNYQFCYGTFQPYWLMTRISSRHGLRGNAHSEVFTFLSEQGFVGLFIGVIFTLSILLRGVVQNYKWEKTDSERLFSLAILCGLITYSFHGFMNMFSDQIETASIVWMSIAIIARNNKDRMDTL